MSGPVPFAIQCAVHVALEGGAWKIKTTSGLSAVSAPTHLSLLFVLEQGIQENTDCILLTPNKGFVGLRYTVTSSTRSILVEWDSGTELFLDMAVIRQNASSGKTLARPA